MAKFLLSNDKGKYDYIKNIYLDTGFNRFNEYTKDNLYFSAYEKIRVNNCNFIKIDNDFVASSGTLIYKEIIGREALKNIYDDFNNDIQDIRNHIIGNYALIIKKENKIYVFGDENNIHNIYYYNKNKKWILSNTQFHIAKALNDVEIDEFNLIEYAFQYSILDNGTIFKNIKKLMGDECIVLDLNHYNFNLNKININYPDIQIKDIDSMVKDFAGLLQNKIKIISKNFKTITISMTGGLDSRMVLAGFLSNNIKPNITYGVGNSQITNTKNRDLEINKIYSENFGLKFYEMNWKTNKDIFEYWDKSLLKYGELFRIYGASKNVFSEFEEKLDTQFIEFGYFGETLRNRPWLENISSNFFTIDEFVSEFYINNSYIKQCSKYKEYRGNLRCKFENIIKKNNLNKKKLTKNDFYTIYNYWFNGGAHNLINNFNNLFFNSISILSIKEINYFSKEIPYEYKKNAKFMLKVLYYLYPDILDVPFFSHCHDQTFNKDKFELEYKKVYLKKIKDILIPIIKKNKKIFNLIKVIYYLLINKDGKALDEDKDSSRLTKLFLNYIIEKQDKINFLKNLKNIEIYNESLGSLGIFAQMLFMIENIKYRD